MIEQVSYLLVLLVALICLAFIDRRFKLALFVDARTTAKVLAAGVLLFLFWDILGIRLGIFYVGDAQVLTGLRVLPQVPIEELFFLLLLNYNALLLWRGGSRLWPRT